MASKRRLRRIAARQPIIVQDPYARDAEKARQEYELELEYEADACPCCTEIEIDTEWAVVHDEYMRAFPEIFAGESLRIRSFKQ